MHSVHTHSATALVSFEVTDTFRATFSLAVDGMNICNQLALSICNILLKVIVYLIKFYYASEQFNPDFVKDLNKIPTNVQSPLDCFDMYVCLLSNCKSQVLTNQEEEGQISPFSQIFPNNSQHFLQTLKTILQILKMS